MPMRRNSLNIHQTSDGYFMSCQHGKPSDSLQQVILCIIREMAIKNQNTSAIIPFAGQ